MTLVSCVCPTKNRVDWIPRAVECFQSQTYPNLEMLIVHDPGYSAVFEDERIRVIEAPSGITLGAKRNFACSQARGEIIANFDDDDWSDPGRVLEEVNHLAQTGLSVTGYSLMKFTDGHRWWRYNGDPNHAHGSSQCFRRDWWEKHPYPDVQIGSDTLFSSTARAAGQLFVVPAGDMMFARLHAGNTNKNRDMNGPAWLALPETEAICA